MWGLLGRALGVLAGLVYFAALLRLVFERDEQRYQDGAQERQREAEGLDLEESAGPQYGPLYLVETPKTLRASK
jgi:hypothetical protein